MNSVVVGGRSGADPKRRVRGWQWVDTIAKRAARHTKTNRRPGLNRSGGTILLGITGKPAIRQTDQPCGTPEAAATSAAKSDTSFSMPSPSWKRT